MDEPNTNPDVNTSGNEPATSIESTPEFQKALSDHLAKAGREAKRLQDQEAKLREREERLRKEEEERELRELEGAKDDPELLSVVERKRKLAAEIRKLNEERDTFYKERESLKDKLSKAEEMERTERLQALAEEKHVDLSALKKAAGLITDPTVLTEIADLLPKTAPKLPPNDSGKSAGSTTFSRKGIADMTTEEYAKHRDALWAAAANDKIK